MTDSPKNRRLRILHIISGDLWAGAEAQAFTLLTHLTPYCEVYAVLLNEGELAKRLRNCKIPVIILNESYHSAWQILLKLRKTIKALQPDVIHTHRQKENVLGAIANATTIKAVCVRTVHGAPEYSDGLKAKVQRTVDCWVGRNLQHSIIAVSEDLKKKLITDFSKDKLKVIYNGVDRDTLLNTASIADFKLNDPNFRHIGIIGRLVPVKRIDIFLETAAMLHKKEDKNYLFHIIGDGPLHNDLINRRNKLGLQNVVKFHGHRQDIPSCIRSLDAIVMCSDHEGMPMVALEAICLETPLLAHSIGGLVELGKIAEIGFSQNNQPEEYAKLITQCPAKMIIYDPGAVNISAEAYLAVYDNKGVLS